MGNPRGVKRDFRALEQRRFAALKLLRQGYNQSEVARRVKVCSQTVSRWARTFSQQGEKALDAAGRAGRKPLLDEKQRERLIARLLEGPEKLGYETPLWTCDRVAHLIQERVWGGVPLRACLEDLAATELESAATGGAGPGAQRTSHRAVETQDLAGH